MPSPLFKYWVLLLNFEGKKVALGERQREGKDREWPSIFHFNMNNSMKNISQYMSLWWFLFNLKFNTNETIALFLEFNNVFFYE